MIQTLKSIRQLKLVIAIAAVLAGCTEQAPLPSEPHPIAAEYLAVATFSVDGAIATLRRVTARYHNLEVAKADGFVLLHPCESRPGEGLVGAVYVNFARLLDGVISAESPEALIYEPRKNGREVLVGVEFAMPYPLWTNPSPPTFMGAAFQREDEFGVYALHAWVWRHNPEGMFAESNPRVTCEG